MKNKEKLLRKVVTNKSKIFYFSSNTVFDCNSIPDEFSAVSPFLEYGRQKVFMENIVANFDNYAIVRLSKLVSLNEGFFSELVNKIIYGLRCDLFYDLNLSPIFPVHITSLLSKIIKGDASGVFHISNQEQWSYFELGLTIARALKKSEKSINPVSTGDSIIPILFKPKFSQLGMVRSHDILGMGPVNQDDFISAFKYQLKFGE